MNNIKLIALDLDGTLLNSNKELTPRTLKALEDAAAQGIQIVPTTGRNFGGLPALIRDLSFVRYAILLNGASVYDSHTDTVIATSNLSSEDANRVIDHVKALPVVYDICQKDSFLMNRAFYDRLGEFAISENALSVIRSLRTPVDDIAPYLADGSPVQKIVAFCKTPEEARVHRLEMAKLFPDLNVTSSWSNNIEVNSKTAHKGAAMEALCRHLGFTLENAMAVGDGINDLSMIAAAGLGIAMKNACPEALAAAKVVTASNDEDGVAVAIEQHALN